MHTLLFLNFPWKIHCPLKPMLADTTANKNYEEFVILLNKRVRMSITICMYVCMYVCGFISRNPYSLSSHEAPTVHGVLRWGLNFVDYSVWTALRERVNIRQKICSLDWLKQQLQEEWTRLSQNTVDASIIQWRCRLQTCIGARGGHFKN